MILPPCACGCGRPVYEARSRYLLNHDKRAKGPRYVEEDRGYETPCWIWQLSRSPLGYGKVKANGDMRLAHRIEWEQRNGPVPDGLELDHLCRVKACINPEHLEAVTHTENMRRGGRTKLTIEQVREIKASDEHYMRLAERYGVHWATINDIRFGRNWVGV